MMPGRLSAGFRHSVVCACLGCSLVATAAFAESGEPAVQRRQFERVGVPMMSFPSQIQRFDEDVAAQHAGFQESRSRRLTPDERRRLRDDIRAAGRDLYRDPPP